MRYKRLLAWVLTFIIAVGMLPILPARVVNAGEGDGEPVNNVVRSLKGITEPAGGWGTDFTASTFKFAKDASIQGSVPIQATTASAYQEQPNKWKPVIESTDYATTASVNVPQSEANGGEEFSFITTINSRYGYDQISGMIYNITSGKVLAYGKVGDTGSGEKKFIVPAGMPVGSYKLWLFLEKFGADGEADRFKDMGTVPFILKKSGDVEACDVTINFDLPIKRISGGAIAQTKITGAMTPVVIGLSDNSKYYFPADYESLGTFDGITVARDSQYQLFISGTPAKKTTEIFLGAPKLKTPQLSPETEGQAEKITGTTTDMEYADAIDAAKWNKCSDGETAVAAGTWYVRYAGTDTKQPSAPQEVIVTAASEGYYVLINVPENSYMTRDINSGSTYQAGLDSEMKPVIFKADNGYYFPENYPVETKNGVTLARTSSTQIEISGMPEDNNVTFNLTPASRTKSTPSAPANVAGDEMKITGTTKAMEYSDAETPGEWKACLDNETPVTTPGVKNVRYKATDKANSSNVTEVVVKPKEEEEEKPASGFSVMIENPYSNHITIGAETEKLYYQTGITGAMQSVVYYANAEYYFPSSYKVAPVNGVRVVRSGSQMLTVKGTPTADTVIQLLPAISINTPLYEAKIINGTGTENYIAGTAVEIKADDKSGQTFTGWKVNKGNISIINAKSKTATFVMPASDVEVEACYSSGNSGSQGGNDNSSGSDSSGGNGSSSGSGGSSDGKDTGKDTSTGIDPSTGGSTVVTPVITPVSSEIIAANSKLLDISAKVKWSKDAFKATWTPVNSAAGYDVLIREGMGTPNNYVQVNGGSSNTAYIKSISGKAIDRTKIHSFEIKAYRIVNGKKDYIGNSRILYVAGDKNKKYTNVSKLKPSKKTVTVKKGKKKKLQTKYKKQNSDKKLVTDSSDKKLNYYSLDPSIATVDPAGKVKGVKKGKCKIYIVAHNGVRTSVTVVVK